MIGKPTTDTLLASAGESILPSAAPTNANDGRVQDNNVSDEIADSSPRTTEDFMEVLEQFNKDAKNERLETDERLKSFIPNEIGRWEMLRDQMLRHSDLLKYTRRVVDDEFTLWSADEAFTSYLLDW